MIEPAYAALAFDSALRAMLYGPPLIRVSAEVPPVDRAQIAVAVRRALIPDTILTDGYVYRPPQDPQ